MSEKIYYIIFGALRSLLLGGEYANEINNKNKKQFENESNDSPHLCQIPLRQG